MRVGRAVGPCDGEADADVLEQAHTSVGGPERARLVESVQLEAHRAPSRRLGVEEVGRQPMDYCWSGFPPARGVLDHRPRRLRGGGQRAPAPDRSGTDSFYDADDLPFVAKNDELTN